MCRPGILVVGGGIAGQAVCEAIRARDGGAAVTLACAEPHLPYDRVRLGTLLDPDGSVETLRLRPDTWYEDQRIRVLTGARVKALAPDQGSATLAGGEMLTFDRVVLCTGSDALVPPFGNAGAAGVHVFRDPADCEAIRGSASPGSTRGGHRRWAARPGGGLRTGQARLHDHRRPSG